MEIEPEGFMKLKIKRVYLSIIVCLYFTIISPFLTYAVNTEKETITEPALEYLSEEEIQTFEKITIEDLKKGMEQAKDSGLGANIKVETRKSDTSVKQSLTNYSNDVMHWVLNTLYSLKIPLFIILILIVIRIIFFFKKGGKNNVPKETVDKI